MKRYIQLFLFAGLSLAVSGCWQSPRTVRPADNLNSRNVSEDNSNRVRPTATSTPSSNSNMDKPTQTGFFANLPTDFQNPTDNVGKKLLKEYGSVFIARGGAFPPKTVVFKDDADVSAFQNSLGKTSAKIGNFELELQTAAMAALKDAISAAQAKGLKITPRGADSAKRTYNETVSLWKSRVDPALTHWVSKGRLTQAEADKIKALSTFEQVNEVLKLEEKGIFFALDLSKSIIYSVAPPGTSQHLSMLALDVSEFENADVRRILADHGWFQTVASDLPHFTYLGAKESELPGLGLKKVSNAGRDFWVPNI